MIETLKIDNTTTTLVDSVEHRLLRFFKEQNLRPGSSIPSEVEMAKALGVGRAVLREALSRFKMTGMIVSRTKKGMVLAEPSIFGGMKLCLNPLLMNDDTLLNLLEFRVALEIGISDAIFSNVTPTDIEELQEIVDMGLSIENNKYAPISEYHFHTKLYAITGNRIISEFQELIHPVLVFVKEKHQEFFAPIEQELMQKGEIVTHHDLFEYIRRGDLEGYKQAIVGHFRLYTLYIERKKQSQKGCDILE